MMRPEFFVAVFLGAFCALLVSVWVEPLTVIGIFGLAAAIGSIMTAHNR